jgi:hypothetical protein
MLGYDSVHPTLKWIWKTKRQTKHKVFFWLLLQDMLNTREGGAKKKYVSEFLCM